MTLHIGWNLTSPTQIREPIKYSKNEALRIRTACAGAMYVRRLGAALRECVCAFLLMDWPYLRTSCISTPREAAKDGRRNEEGVTARTARAFRACTMGAEVCNNVQAP